MSSVFDVDTITIDDGTPAVFGVLLDNITVTVESDVETVTISQPSDVSSTQIEVPGIQGPPGLKNVYTQLANPATQYGWGISEKGFIWIEVDV